MSSTIDSRVVEMRFDNKQFESGARESLSTIDRLKQALNFSDTSRGFTNLQKAADGVNMNGLGSAVESVKVKFSALEIAAITALQNVVNKAVDAGERLVKSLSIDQVTAGFEEYELKMGSIQTIMASTGESLETVNGYLNELNTYSDKTIYSFSDMTQNIGKFTNAGVKLPDAVKAIQGVSNAAAVAGANSNEASRAMYNFAQALSAGSVKLIDWKSIENANMGTVEFKQSLIDTAVAMGTVVKIGDKYKSTTTDLNGKTSQLFDATTMFNDSLSSQWMTTDVLVQSLSNYSTDVRDMSKEEKAAYEEKLKSIGYTEEQIKGIEELGKKAFDSAQDVKTASQLMDTLKESVGSGWAQTFELIVGDFEEAKKLWTDVNNVIGDILNKQATQRNKLLQGWKDAGGRDALLDGLANSWKAIVALIKPIKEAFRDIFPPATSKQLLTLTQGFKEFTSNLIISDSTSSKLKRTFTGLFSVLNVIKQAFGALFTLLSPGVSIIKSLASGFLTVTAALGDWASGLNKTISGHQLFLTIAETLLHYIDNLKESFKSLSSSGSIYEKLGNLISSFTEKFTKMVDSFRKSLPSFSGITSAIGNTLTSLGKNLAEAFSGDGIDAVMNMLAGGVLASIGVNVSKLIESFTGVLDTSTGFISGLGAIKDSVVDTFSAIQSQLKAGALLKIAAAIGILALSLITLATIEPSRLKGSLAAITVLFADLFGMMAAFEKIVNGKGLRSIGTISKAMISLSASVLILAIAMKKMSSIEPSRLLSSLGAVSLLLGELTAVAVILSKYGGKVKTGATSMIGFAAALVILTNAVIKLATMNYEQLVQGLIGLGVLMGELVGFTKLLGNTDHLMSSAAAMLIMAAAMNLLAVPLMKFGNMSLEQIGKGLLAMGVALGEIAIAMQLLPNDTMKLGIGLAAVGAALLIVTSSVEKMGNLSWEQIAKGLITMGLAIGELAVGLNLMKGTLSGAAAMLIASAAILTLTPALKALGGMSIKQIATSLGVLAGAFIIVGAAGLLLAPVAPAVLAISASVALLAVSALAFSAALVSFTGAFMAIRDGMTSIGVAINKLGWAITKSSVVAAVRAMIVGSLEVIRDSIKSFGEVIMQVVLTICDIVVTCAPTIIDTILTLIKEVMKSLAKNVPSIVTSLMDLLIGVLNALGDRMPELVTAAVNLFVKFFASIVEALKSIDTKILEEALAGVGVMALLMTAFAALATLAPGAMTGILAMGAVVAELAALLAAIGALSQIPGLMWLIDKGGNLLEGIGTAIGKFIGGIVGGFMSGIADQFPKIAMDLSMFMMNLQPFLLGARNIDANLLSGVQALAKTILILTATSILEGLAGWLTGGNTLVKFGKELAMFAPFFWMYYTQVKNIDGKVVQASANAAQSLSKMAASLPNQGGIVSWFTGDNRLSVFGKELSQFGPYIAKYAEQVKNLDPKAVSASASAAKTLSEMAANLPNQGGIVSWFTGDNRLSVFGKELSEFGPYISKYAEQVKGIDPTAVEASVNAAKSLSNMADNLPNQGGVVSWFTGDNRLSIFGKELSEFGPYIADYAKQVANIDVKVVNASVNAAKALSELAKNLPNQGGLLSWFSGDNDLGTFGSNLKKFGASMSDYYNSISGINASLLSTVVSEVRKLVNLAKDISGIDTSGMARFGKDLKKMGDNGITEFLTAFKNSEPKVQKAAKSLCTTMTNQMKKVLSASALKTIGKNTGTYLATGINSSSAAVQKAAKSMATTAKNAVKNNMSSNYFHVIGANAAIGLANGITSQINSIANAAINAAATAINSARRTLQVRSPSRVFTEMGEYVSIGLSNGILNKLGLISDSGETMADRVIDPVQMALERISDAVDDNLDMNPSIVPTIDLSRVMDGASRISSMFGGFNLAPTNSLAQGAYSSFGANANATKQQDATNKVLTDKLDKLIDVTSDEARTENHNVFNIQSTDPRQAAEEVGYILQHKLERGKAAWAR